MKLFIHRDNFLNALQIVQRAVKNSLTNSGGIFFQAKENQLTLIASDPDLFIRCQTEAQIEQEGSILLPARYITDFAKRLPNTLLQIESNLENTQLKIQYGNSEFNLNAYNAESFPEFVLPEAVFSFEIEAEKLKDIFKQVLFAASNDISQPVFTGVLLEIEDNLLTAVTTDSYRMAIRKSILDFAAPEKIKIIIPAKTIGEFIRTSDFRKQIQVTIGARHLVLASEKTIFIIRLIAGKYPSYQQVIPKEFSAQAVLNRNEFLDSAERVALLAGEKKSNVQLSLNQAGLTLTIRAESGWIREELETEFSGQDLEIGYNVKFLNDILRVLESEKIYLKPSGPYSPSIFQALEETEKEQFLAILVPVKINRAIPHA